MELRSSLAGLRADPTALGIYEYLSTNEEELRLEAAVFYFDFPVYKTEEDEVLACSILVVSRHHGIIAIGLPAYAPIERGQVINQAQERLNQILPYMLSRLIRQTSLRKSTSELKFPIVGLTYVPHQENEAAPNPADARMIGSHRELGAFLGTMQAQTLSDSDLADITATLEGAKGLIRLKARRVENLPVHSKGRLVARLEQEIANFDLQQREGTAVNLVGPQRIRGLAGSGKTVVLAMKAAQIHLRFPDAVLVYTFSTKSLYQHIKRLVTRFYRQFDDRDPDWDRIRIMHAWGGRETPGVYSTACIQHGIRPLNVTQARRMAPGKEFAFACENLLNQVDVEPMYDHVLVDEGQDFPVEFLRLCGKLARDRKFVFAYDELQSIFQTDVPTANDVFGPDAEGNVLDNSSDVVLYKCYRNPREILVCAHAIGFGIYGDRIVQMLENRDHWHDVGYTVRQGDFSQGSQIVIERLPEHSLKTISEHCSIDEVVRASDHNDLDAEVHTVCANIASDIGDGLQPEDILVVVMDDRNAKTYLSFIASVLQSRGIETNNVHEDDVGLREFQLAGRVTLSTVYKAKGNESFMVYVVGVDAVFERPTVIQRNKVFAALTRAKGWVRVSGIGLPAKRFCDELQRAKQEFPFLRFAYPSSEDLRVMKRDLRAAAIEKLQLERQLDLLVDVLGHDVVMARLRRAAKVPKKLPQK